MNQEKIGKFIATCRKKQNLTQEQLAEKLGVTDKSVSRWENGKSMPDVSLFKSLCEVLNITINELLSGEKINSDLCNQKTDKNIQTTFNQKKKLKRIFKIIVIIFIVLFSIFVFHKLYPPGNISNYSSHFELDNKHSQTDIQGAIHTFTLYFQKNFRNSSLIQVYYYNDYEKLEKKWQQSALENYNDILVLYVNYRKKSIDKFSYFVLVRKNNKDWQVIDKFS